MISKPQFALTATHDWHHGQTRKAARKSDVEKAAIWTLTCSGHSIGLEQKLMKVDWVARD